MTVTTPRAPDRSVRRNPMAALAVLFGFGLALTYLLFVRSAVGQKVDNAALIGRGVVPEEFVADAWTILDTISVVGLALATLAIVTVAALRGRWWQAAGAGVVILGANLTTQVLKHVVLTRPDLTAQTIKDFNTFPSGHATVAISVAAALLLVVTARQRALVAVPAMVYATAVGVATVTAGWHRPSDAIGAWFVVGAWTAAVAGLLMWTLAAQRDEEADIVQGLEAGADDYIVKPFDSQDLKIRLRAGRSIVDLQTNLIAAREALRHQATHDSLTGVWNRAAIMDALRRELARGSREGEPVAVVMAA